MVYRLERILLLLLVRALTVGDVTDAATFPEHIGFSVSLGATKGSFDLSFEKDADMGNGAFHLMVLRNFSGLGFGARQQLRSYIFKKDLALYGHIVLDDEKRWVHSVFWDDSCGCFNYRERSGSPHAEIVTPHPAIDLVSTILVVTREAAKPTFSPVDLTFILNKTAQEVTLIREGLESLETPLGRRETVVLSLRLKLKDETSWLYRFYVGRDAKGHYPVKMIFVDVNGLTELVAERVKW